MKQILGNPIFYTILYVQPVNLTIYKSLIRTISGWKIPVSLGRAIGNFIYCSARPAALPVKTYFIPFTSLKGRFGKIPKWVPTSPAELSYNNFVCHGPHLTSLSSNFVSSVSGYFIFSCYSLGYFLVLLSCLVFNTSSK